MATLALALPGALPCVADATTNPEMRGEWQISVTNSKTTAKGTAIISQEANGSGEFESSSALVEGVVPAVFSGTLHSAEEASVKIVAQSYQGVPGSEFTSSTISVKSSGGVPTMSGSGTITVKSNPPSSEPGTFSATRVRTYKELEEQKEREEREQHEREAREHVRGEWALKVEAGSEKVEGIARITLDANAKNEFASSAALFGGALPGSFDGTLEGTKTKVTITSQASGSFPEATFTSSTITVSTSSNPTSMTGSGTLTIHTSSPVSVPATLTATRVKNYTELKALEAQEKLEREAAEKKAREAKEAQEAAERAQREARERQEREAKEAQEREAREKLEAQSKATEKTSLAGGPPSPAVPLSKTLTVSSSGSLSIALSNPNASAVKGSIALTAASSHTGKATSKSRGKGKKPAPLASASFTIAADGHTTVKLALSKTARAELARSKTLTVTATVLTETSTGGARVSRSYKLTLKASSTRSHH